MIMVGEFSRCKGEKKIHFVFTYLGKTLAAAIPYNTCVTWFLARQYFFLATNHVRREIAVYLKINQLF